MFNISVLGIICCHLTRAIADSGGGTAPIYGLIAGN